MTGGGEWLGADEVAELARITRRHATRIMATRSWRDCPLEVRQVVGRGGKAGLNYEVSLSSLSEALGDDLSELMELPCDEGAIPLPAANQGAVVGERWAIIKDALDHPDGAKRAAAVKAAAAASGKGERTLYRWIADYERHGLHGLARRKPKNAGKPRIHVSREFDRAFREADGADELLIEIGNLVDQEIKTWSATRLGQHAGEELQSTLNWRLFEICTERGLSIPRSAFKVSKKRILRRSEYRAVNDMKNDRKRFDDAKPRARRDWTGYDPMEIVICDVKPLDVIVTRPDGTPTWPKLIGFMDGGTGRVRHHLVLCPKGEGVRQEHVWAAIIAMNDDREWGLPKALYLDNGSEFKGLDKLQPALALMSEVGVRTIIRAKPYNGAAKPIEGLFAQMDKRCFSLMPGYAGSERMNKKTQTVGRPPKPYPGSWEQFQEDVEALIKVFNARPVGGQWQRRSPREWTQAKIDAGWRPSRVSPTILDAMGCEREARKLTRGCIKHGGEFWHHDALLEAAPGAKVLVALPWRRDAAPLIQLKSGDWEYLQPDGRQPALWEQGAKVAAVRQAAQRKYVAGLAKDAGTGDLMAMKRRMAAVIDPLDLPGDAGRLGGTSEMIALGNGLASPVPRQEARLDEAARLKRREDAETARLEALAAKSEEMRRAG
ncbi:MAG: hypothetical protein K9G59_07685 [Caulobacter sp.]|nr:hypothetical protein [Caulobacter sp.]